MDQNDTKGLCIALFFVDTLFFGCLPCVLIRCGGNSLRAVSIRSAIISYLNCFAGGVFLAATLLHLLVEGQEKMKEYFKKSGHNVDYPVFESVTAAGFFIIATVETLAHKLMHHRTPRNRQDAARTDAARSVETPPRTDVRATQDKGPQPERPNYDPGVQVKGITNHAYSLDANNPEAVNGQAKDTALNNVVYIERLGSDTHGEHEHSDEFVGVLQVLEVSPMKAFLLLGALSFHTVFDGLAVGLQTDITKVWEMFTAIIVHKSLVGVCLGLQLFLVYTSQPIKAVLWILFFSLISPIGVGIGMVLTSGDIDPLAKELTSAILQGVATGTFLYVTCFEILYEEIVKKRGLLRNLVTVLGFGAVAAAKVLDHD